jgi:hypothetical protein
MDDATEVNEYLALRATKIKRNEARLRDLGLSSRPVVASQARENRRNARASSNSNASNRTAASALPVRRSKRMRQPPGSYAEPLDLKRSRRRNQYGSTEVQREEGENKDEDFYPSFVSDEVEGPTRLAKKIVTPRPPTTTASLPANSARVMRLNVTKLVSDSLLGRTLSQTGKAHVMEESANLAVDGYTGGHISFNKYSGVQEWGNNTLFLWINLDAPNSEVTNDFPNGGRQVTWFGGSRMHEGTHAIQQLLRAGKHPSETGGVVLWCRQYRRDRKTFDAYTCLGRLSYASHQPGSRPLAFVWNLVDFEGLRNQAVFQSMVSKEK